jgi:hypothetical protein
MTNHRRGELARVECESPKQCEEIAETMEGIVSDIVLVLVLLAVALVVAFQMYSLHRKRRAVKIEDGGDDGRI